MASLNPQMSLLNTRRMHGLTGKNMFKSLSGLPARMLHVSLLKSPNSSTPSAAKIKKRSMKRRPRFPTCRETTGCGRDTSQRVLPTQKRGEINVLHSKSTHKKLYGRNGLTSPLTETVHTTITLSERQQ